MGIIVRNPPPCPQCRALGAFERDGTKYELFFCLLRLHSLPIVDPNWPTVMARFDDGPEDFIDGIANRHPALKEARRRASRRGLYDRSAPLSPEMQRVVEALADFLWSTMDIGEDPELPR